MAHSLLRKLSNRFNTDNSGNVALTFAIALLPLLLSVGAAVDYSRFSSLKGKAASATDAALLAATAEVMKNVDVNDLQAVLAKLNSEFEPFFLANMNTNVSYQYNGSNLSYDVATKVVSVEVDINYPTSVMGIAGVNEMNADISAATSLEMKAGGAVSMYLALDVSGSMAWSNGENGTKMDALKGAVGNMITTLISADPGNKYVRLGVDGYESYVYYRKNLRWNLNNIKNYVQTFYAYGGTNSAPSLDRAFTQLKKQKEIDEHATKSGQTPDLVVVFMTDGDNNHNAYDTATLNSCAAAKSYGMTVYTVAYKAPANGQALLSSCASSEKHYFRAENVAELASAFGYIGATVAQNLMLSQ